MTPEDKKLWVDALRSGKYKQGKYKLASREKKEDEFEYCCLGVACEVFDIEKASVGFYDIKYGIEEKDAILPKELMDRLRIDKFGSLPETVMFKEEERLTLTVLNDMGADFNFIADVIEEQF